MTQGALPALWQVVTEVFLQLELAWLTFKSYLTHRPLARGSRRVGQEMRAPGQWALPEG